MAKRKATTRNQVYDNQQLSAALVRSWRDQFRKESRGGPLLLIIGGKVLEADDIFSNIAEAIDRLPRPNSTEAAR